MHELITRSIECFLRDTYGEAFWAACLDESGATRAAAVGLSLTDEAGTRSLIQNAAERLKISTDALLEDLGTYLVSHGNSQRVRRLLRFSGETFEDFLYSLDDLPDRVRLAVGDLILPNLEFWEEKQGKYRIVVEPALHGFASVLLGGLRAMADDYGALVLLELEDEAGPDERACIQVAVLDGAFAEGNDFNLSSVSGTVRSDMGGLADG